MRPLGQNFVEVDADSLGVTKWMHRLLWQCYDGIYHLQTIFISRFTATEIFSLLEYKKLERTLSEYKFSCWIWIHFLQNYFCKYVINFKSRAIQVTGNVWKPADLLHFYLCQFSPLTSDQYFERRTNRLHILVPPRTNRLIYIPTWFKAGSGGKGVWW